MPELGRGGRVAATVSDENDVALAKGTGVGLDDLERAGEHGVDAGAAGAALEEGGLGGGCVGFTMATRRTIRTSRSPSTRA
jgi:hypothetical protein